MIEREIEVLDRTIDETGEVAVELANVRDALATLTADDIRRALSTIVERVDGVANVLTALSIDLTRVNNSLAGGDEAEET
jgi:hypothetical protein